MSGGWPRSGQFTSDPDKYYGNNVRLALLEAMRTYRGCENDFRARGLSATAHARRHFIVTIATPASVPLPSHFAPGTAPSSFHD